ncbi:MAG TPA: amidohydrolase family protein [Xanthomonadales bacterium]|nr:amidohydrolase family protein [Xanthomonadales bacterium]
MNLRSLLLLIALSGTALAGEDSIREYTWLTVGEPSGSMLVRQADDGSTRMSFTFNDRGRGPETESILRINDRGVPVELEITGKNYLKGAVDERFSAGDGIAEWKSSIENGRADFDGSAFFVPNEGAPAIMGSLARAILAAESGAIELLPTGKASIAELATHTLKSGDAEAHITLYGITGLDSTPQYVWLDENREFFGFDAGWFGITPKGWESQIDVLKKTQDEATNEFFQTLASQLTENLEGPLVVKGARIFDSIKGELTEPATVFTWKGKISAVYFSQVAIPEEARVIDASGKTLMPSLWDMHGHVDVKSYLNYLASGVTNVRDMANDPEVIYKLGEDVRSGSIIGPDVYALGFIDKRGEFAAPTGKLADSVEDAITLVDYYAQHGFHGIKLYSSIEPAWVKPISDHAHQRGMEVKGHIPAYMNATQAIEAGFDEITHINMVLLNFLGAEKLDTRTPTRFTVPGEQGREVDLGSAEVRDFVALMKDKDIALDPTLAIFMDMFLNEPGQVSPVFRHIADHLPANVRRQSIAGAGRNDGKEQMYAESALRMQELLLTLHEAGIQLLPGTDNALPGFSLIRELMYYVEAGIPANEALQLATIGAATHMGQQERLGSVSVGKDAQFYIVDGDPTTDIQALYHVEQVVKGRQLFAAPDILRAQGFVPFVRQ